MTAIEEQAASQLLTFARSSLTTYVQRRKLYRVSWQCLPPLLQRDGSSFVTLVHCGRLRGCIGSTKGAFPLAYDVIRNAVAAARDPRFEPVSPQELPDIRLEVSVLQRPQTLVYADEQDLHGKLRPGHHGVIVTWHGRQALLLPQVWERIPDRGEFLQTICEKAEIPRHAIRDVPPTVGVLIFEATILEEDGYYVEN